MKKYLLVIHQDGGCDYTIECGTKTIEFEAQNFEVALVKASLLIKEDYSHDEAKINKATLHEVSDSQIIDVDLLFQELDEEKLHLQELRKESFERNLLKQLKEKYEK